MKKWVSWLLVLALCMSPFAACGQKAAPTPAEPAPEEELSGLEEPLLPEKPAPDGPRLLGVWYSDETYDSVATLDTDLMLLVGSGRLEYGTYEREESQRQADIRGTRNGSPRTTTSMSWIRC